MRDEPTVQTVPGTELQYHWPPKLPEGLTWDRQPTYDGGVSWNAYPLEDFMWEWSG